VATAKAVGYAPLEAEADYVSGRDGNFCSDGDAALAALEDAIFAAEASRHEEVAAEAAIIAAGIYGDRLRDTRAARRWLRYADALVSRLPGHPILEAYKLVSWGIVEQMEGDYEGAMRDQRRALELKEQALGPLHPDTAISTMNLGNVLHDIGRDAEAEPYGRRAAETMERILGPESGQTAVALFDWGEQLAGLGRRAEARQAFDRAIAIWTKADASPFFIACGRVDLARLELAEKRPLEARRLLEPSIDVIAKQDRERAAEGRFLLAQALWSERRERARAAGLAREARGTLVAASAPAPKRAEIDAWLAAHATP
jgi:tetratricopeptide (TPR) repeat protein